MGSAKDFAEKLKQVGLTIIDKAKTSYKTTRDSIEQNFLNDSLRKRFNLENPYKFIIMDNVEKTSFLNELLPRYAKRYNEDDVFVFYGSLADNDIKVGYIIKDLSDNTLYKVKELAMVQVPVTYNNKDYDVECTAVYGEII